VTTFLFPEPFKPEAKIAGLGSATEAFPRKCEGRGWQIIALRRLPCWRLSFAVSLFSMNTAF